MGSRTEGNERAEAWAANHPATSSTGVFEKAAAFGEIVFNCIRGDAVPTALDKVSAENLAGKILVDVSNPLHFTEGKPPSLFICNTDSLGEQVQAKFPGTRVLKAFNTVTADVMVNPALLPGEHDLFFCGNDQEAKNRFTEFVKVELGWRSVIDLGGIESARNMEMMLPLWINLFFKYQSPHFNFRIVRKDT